MTTDSDVSSALLSFLSSNDYPPPELASAAITNASIANTLSGLDELLHEAESSIRDLSQKSKSDIDPWIKQARDLSQRIEDSKIEAASILQEQKAQVVLNDAVKDAQAKVTLLAGEVEFVTSLTWALDNLAVCVGLADSAAGLLADGEVHGAIDKVGQAEGALRGIGDARVKGVLERRVRGIREEAVGVVRGMWNHMVQVHDNGRGLVITQKARESDMSLEEVVNEMKSMGILQAVVTRLHRDLDACIVSPRVIPAGDGSAPRVNVSDSEIHLIGRSNEDMEVEELIDDAYKIIKFILKTLPKMVSEQLLDKILPSLMVQVVSRWLDPSMPLELDNLERFQSVTSKVSELASFLARVNVEIPSDADPSNWLAKIPQNWLARRKEAALSNLRANCYASVRQKAIAERVETQIISSDDVMYGEREGTRANPVNLTKEEEPEQTEDWDSGWNDDQDHGTSNDRSQPSENVDDEDDVAAWGGLDEDEAVKPDAAQSTNAESHDDDPEAWGWGDDNEETGTVEESIESKPQKVLHSRNQNADTPAAPKTITLRETYTITHIPTAIFQLVQAVLDDATTLSNPAFPIREISHAVPGLSTIPTLILALFRATANTYYVNEPASNMLLYNDATNLSTSLQKLLSDIQPNHPLANLQTRLEPDVATLLSFARRAYGREMAAQRTILVDILSSASGFVNCTLPLNAKQYKATVDDAVSRVRDLNSAWNGVLSDSARLQSLGGLVSELTRGVTSDILERADDPQGISEGQSKNLKGFIDQVAGLQDLFHLPNHVDRAESPSLVHVYTAGWFRFIYLGEILEASLADIRYLWSEGELKLEFDANEVIDLIQALFADSSHRKDAIRAVKRTSMNRG